MIQLNISPGNHNIIPLSFSHILLSSLLIFLILADTLLNNSFRKSDEVFVLALKAPHGISHSQQRSLTSGVCVGFKSSSWDIISQPTVFPYLRSLITFLVYFLRGFLQLMSCSTSRRWDFSWD
ncbi:hypothetical protein BsWGS_22234 [Bradybaena similaris]